MRAVTEIYRRRVEETALQIAVEQDENEIYPRRGRSNFSTQRPGRRKNAVIVPFPADIEAPSADLANTRLTPPPAPRSKPSGGGGDGKNDDSWKPKCKPFELSDVEEDYDEVDCNNDAFSDASSVVSSGEQASQKDA